MKGSPVAPAAAVVLAAAALGALALPSCSGDPAKAALRAYEGSVERLMEEDRRISAELAELRKEMGVANADSAALLPYARDTAVPFYERFRRTVAGIPTPGEELPRVHALLQAYGEHRAGYLQALVDLEASVSADAVIGMTGAQIARQEATRGMIEATGGKLDDPQAITAKGTEQIFLRQAFEPFQRGQVPAEELVDRIRSDVLPPYAKLAESTAADLTREDAKGAIARWARAELEYFQALVEAAPHLGRAFGSSQRSEEQWEMAEEVRADYLEALKAHRESLR